SSDEVAQRLNATAREDASGAISKGLVSIAVIVLVGTAIGILFGLFFSNRLIGPLTQLTNAMKELADGNFGVVLPGLGRKDEVGEMAQAVENFKVKADEKARREAAEKADTHAADERAAEMKRVADLFDESVRGAVDTVLRSGEAIQDQATGTAER